MPNCRTCSPWCRRCHKKADYKFPVECPECGWYNPYERDTCKKCGAPVAHDEEKAVTHLNAEVKKACFFCSPFERPLCNECVETGRTKICPECGRKMKQQFIGLQHCKCGMSWKKDIGYFERTGDMVFALERRKTGKKTKQCPVIRYR